MLAPACNPILDGGKRELLALVLEALEPENLAIPERILRYLTTNPYSSRLEDMS